MRTLGRTPEEYLATLPDDRADVLHAVRDVVLAALEPGFVETLRETAIYYEIPRAQSPPGLGKPLIYAGLASQKNYLTLYLRPLYYDPDFRDMFVARWRAGGRDPDLGKSCVRFLTLEDVDLACIRDSVALYTPAEYVQTYLAYRRPAG